MKIAFAILGVLYLFSVAFVFLLLWGDGIPGWREIAKDVLVAIFWPFVMVFGKGD